MGTENPAAKFLLGNDIAEIGFGDSATGTAGLAVSEGLPNAFEKGIGETLTYGRRTSSIFNLNIAGIGGGAGKGGFAALGKIGAKHAGAKAASFLVGIGEFKTAIDVGLALAEGVGCAFHR